MGICCKNRSGQGIILLVYPNINGFVHDMGHILDLKDNNPADRWSRIYTDLIRKLP